MRIGLNILKNMTGYIRVKPMSVNEAWKGRRFKSAEYEAYEWEVYPKLKPIIIPDGKLSLFLTFYLSNKLADIDNPVKPFLDVLQKRYKFNDRDVYEMRVVKKIVKKGEEGIYFKIDKYE